MQPAIPVIRLDSEKLGEEVKEACEGAGFFYLSEHGIAHEEVEGMFEMSRRFFLETDEAVKRQHADRAANLGSCTLLFQRDVGGLQVHLDGRWVDIEPRAGCLVVNVGDAMEFWTGGRFQSTQHRVSMPRSQGHRPSMAYFCQPDETAHLAPLCAPAPTFEARMKAKNIPAGVALTGGSHLRQRLASTYK